MADFVPSTKLKGMEEFTLDSEYFESYLKRHDNPEDENYGLYEAGEGNSPEIQFLKIPISSLEIPKLLVPHSFENGSSLMFPAAARESSSGMLSVYLFIVMSSS